MDTEEFGQKHMNPRQRERQGEGGQYGYRRAPLFVLFTKYYLVLRLRNIRWERHITQKRGKKCRVGFKSLNLN
jgi:hypothetical protein